MRRNESVPNAKVGNKDRANDPDECREPFGTEYAGVYDALYGDKDYPSECDLIERCFREASLPVRTILDLGCGTGRHAAILAERGYQVVGVDRSTPMIHAARRRAQISPAASRMEFHVADLRGFRIERKFDAILMMFAVLSYQVDDDDLRQALHVVRAHLQTGGLYLFDCWYGPAVTHLRPERRTKRCTESTQQVVRTSTSTLDAARQRVVVRFDVEHLVDGVESRTSETHVLRYFFARDLELLLNEAGLSLLKLGAMPDITRTPDETTWNVLGIARRDQPSRQS